MPDVLVAQAGCRPVWSRTLCFCRLQGVNIFDGGVIVLEGLLPDVFIAQAGCCPVWHRTLCFCRFQA